MAQNLLYTNSNPDPTTICPGCEAFIGMIFEPGSEPPLPAHINCYCAYFPTWDEPTEWQWSDLPQDARTVWVRRLAWILRQGWPIPFALIPLTAEAEQYNEEHPDDESEELMAITPDVERTQQMITGQIRLVSSCADQPHTPDGEPTREYDCLFIGAGRARRVDGEDSNWLIPAAALQAAVSLFQGAASYIDHPEQFGFGWQQSPSLRDLVGVCSDPQWSEAEQGIVGKIRLYADDPNSPGAMMAALYDQILRDQAAGRPTPDIGLSAVLWHSSHLDEETGLRITDEINKIDSVDHIYSAGARGYVRAALSRVSSSAPQPGVGFVTADRRDAPVCVPSSANTSGAHAPGGQAMAPETDQGQTQAQQAPQMVTPAAPRAAPPVTTPEPALLSEQGITDVLSLVIQRLDRIEAEQSALAEAGTVEGMGQPPRAHAWGMSTGMDQFSQAVEAMLAGVAPPAGVRPLSGVREMYTLLSGDYEMTGLFNAERVYLANVTSSTMAQMVANVLNKRVMVAFQAYPRWWEAIVTMENFTTLQQVRWITLGGIGELPTVAEGAAYTELTWDDLAQRDSFVKKGGYVGLTLEAIDKDDTRQLQLAPRAIAQAAWLTLSKSISAIFTANSGVGPNVYYDDSNQRALFHTSNSNLGTTALSAAAWEATRIAMRDQTEHNSGEPLGALTAPYYCLVPAELEFTAIQVLATQQIPGSANWEINPEAAGDTREARLSAARKRVVVIDMWTDANNWAAVADPRLYPSIGLGFRFGNTPEIFSVADPRAGLMFSNDVMPVKARFFYATGPVDYRGMYKHNVS
jgi:hypothetical protein